MITPKRNQNSWAYPKPLCFLNFCNSQNPLGFHKNYPLGLNYDWVKGQTHNFGMTFNWRCPRHLYRHLKKIVEGRKNYLLSLDLLKYSSLLQYSISLHPPSQIIQFFVKLHPYQFLKNRCSLLHLCHSNLLAKIANLGSSWQMHLFQIS